MKDKQQLVDRLMGIEGFDQCEAERLATEADPARVSAATTDEARAALATALAVEHFTSLREQYRQQREAASRRAGSAPAERLRARAEGFTRLTGLEAD